MFLSLEHENIMFLHAVRHALVLSDVICNIIIITAVFRFCRKTCIELNSPRMGFATPVMEIYNWAHSVFQCLLSSAQTIGIPVIRQRENETINNKDNMLL